MKCLVLFECPAADSYYLNQGICLYWRKNQSKIFFNITEILLKFCVFIGKWITENLSHDEIQSKNSIIY